MNQNVQFLKKAADNFPMKELLKACYTFNTQKVFVNSLTQNQSKPIFEFNETHSDFHLDKLVVSLNYGSGRFTLMQNGVDLLNGGSFVLCSPNGGTLPPDYEDIHSSILLNLSSFQNPLSHIHDIELCSIPGPEEDEFFTESATFKGYISLIFINDIVNLEDNEN